MGLEKRSASSRRTFTKRDRILQRPDFLRLAIEGKKIQNRHFIAYAQKNDFSNTRLGITVTRKVGNAATRNRIKRIAREFFRHNRQIFKDHWDINLIAKKGSTDISNRGIFSSLENIFVRIETYQQD